MAETLSSTPQEAVQFHTDRSVSKEYDPTTRIVVIGMGIVAPQGNNVKDFWRNMIAGESGIRSISSAPDYADMFAPYEQQINASVGGLIVDFSIDPLLKAGVHSRKEKKN